MKEGSFPDIQKSLTGEVRRDFVNPEGNEAAGAWKPKWGIIA